MCIFKIITQSTNEKVLGCVKKKPLIKTSDKNKQPQFHVTEWKPESKSIFNQKYENTVRVSVL